MQIQALKAEVRQAGGKGQARRLRANGLIPAVFYGPGTDGKVLAVEPKALRKALSTELQRNQPVELDFGGHKELALIRELQIDPISREPVHCDFYRVEENRPVDVRIPFLTTGKPEGLLEGGELRVVLRHLPVRCLPALIPAKIQVDVTPMKLNDVIQVKDLAVVAGVTILLAPERTLVAVVKEEKKEEEVAAVPGAPGAPGAAAAPGAPGAPAAAGGAAAPAAGAAAAPAAGADKGKGKK